MQDRVCAADVRNSPFNMAEERSGLSNLERWEVRLPAPLIAGWRRVARREGNRPGMLLRLVMERVVSGAGETESLDEFVTRGVRGKLHVTLSAAEAAAVREAARAEGKSNAAWVASLIRARLNQAPILTATEIQALEAATAQLASVGRNLNTVVHKLHKTNRWDAESAPLHSLISAVALVRDKVYALIAAGAERAKV